MKSPQIPQFRGLRSDRPPVFFGNSRIFSTPVLKTFEFPLFSPHLAAEDPAASAADRSGRSVADYLVAAIWERGDRRPAGITPVGTRGSNRRRR
jgi:hypothetical protein